MSTNANMSHKNSTGVSFSHFRIALTSFCQIRMASFEERTSETSSENDMENLFHVLDEEDEVFTFDSMSIKLLIESEELEISYKYSMNNIDKFVSKFYIQIPGLSAEDMVSSQLIQDLSLLRIIFSQGMCILHWFWMGFGTTRIEIASSIAEQVLLNQDMWNFWQTVYVPMMAEFLFVNRMSNKGVSLQVAPSYQWPEMNNEDDVSKLNNSKSWGRDKCEKMIYWKENYSVIVPLGGGKDSLVVWKLVRDKGENPLSVYVSDGMFEFSLNYRLPAIIQTMATLSINNGDNTVIVVKHEFIDENFRRLSRSYLEPCGHPWAAVVLFDTLLVGYILDIPKISLGFEKSAEEGNNVFVLNDTVEVNHQYDKSPAFLQLAQQYIATQLTPHVYPESELHHLWELEIARIFCETPALKAFHPLFLSCNEPVQHAHWCAKCDKCAFIYLLLCAWLPEKYVGDVVFETKHMLSAPENEALFLKLIDRTKMKPFDCVGTVTEAREAVSLIAEQFKNRINNEEVEMPVVLKALLHFMSENA